MHVAYIHQHFSTRQGGTGTRSYEMSRLLLERGHRVSMICGAYESSDRRGEGVGRVSESEVDGIHVYTVNEPYANRMGFIERGRAFFRFAGTAGRVAAGLDADLVFATSTPLTVGIPGMKAARLLGVPFVFEVRDLWPDIPIAMGAIRNPLIKWYLRRLERRIYFAAAHIIALSPGMKLGICRTGYPEERVTMVPNACDLDLFRPELRAPLDARFGAPDDFRAIFTGAHGKANGLDAVLDAAVVLKRRGVRGVRLVFIGKGGEKPRLMQRAAEQGLGDVVTWLDAVPKQELAAIVAGMDAGLMVLRNLPDFYYGTSPNKFFDYIAAGLPVLNNYPGWLAEMIAEHRCGIAIPPDDAEAFADALLKLRDDPAGRAEMGRRARRLAETQFDRRQLGERWVNVLEKEGTKGLRDTGT